MGIGGGAVLREPVTQSTLAPWSFAAESRGVRNIVGEVISASRTLSPSRQAFRGAGLVRARMCTSSPVSQVACAIPRKATDSHPEKSVVQPS